MRRIMVVTFVAVIVLFAGWYEGLYRPEGSHIASLKASEQKAQVALLSLETRYRLSEEQEETASGACSRSRNSEQAVPNDPELDSS